MDIDFVLRSFELPRDRPLWELALLARLGEEADAASATAAPLREEREVERCAVILPFRKAARP